MTEQKLPAHWGPDWTWFALRVEPQRELAMEAVLRDDGWYVFVPVKHVLIRPRPRAKRKVLAARAQYPGYVFIGFGPGEDPPWLRILRFRAILGVVGHDGRPTPMVEYSRSAKATTDGKRRSEFGIVPMLAGMNRPINYVQVKTGRRRKNKAQNTAEIVSGPYQGRTVRVINIENDDPELYELFKVAA